MGDSYGRDPQRNARGYDNREGARGGFRGGRNSSGRDPGGFRIRLSDNEIKKLIFSRSKVYSKSKYRINCNNMTKKEIVDKIVGIHESF